MFTSAHLEPSQRGTGEETSFSSTALCLCVCTVEADEARAATCMCGDGNMTASRVGLRWLRVEAAYVRNRCDAVVHVVSSAGGSSVRNRCQACNRLVGYMVQGWAWTCKGARVEVS